MKPPFELVVLKEEPRIAVWKQPGRMYDSPIKWVPAGIESVDYDPKGGKHIYEAGTEKRAA